MRIACTLHEFFHTRRAVERAEPIAARGVKCSLILQQLYSECLRYIHECTMGYIMRLVLQQPTYIQHKLKKLVGKLPVNYRYFTGNLPVILKLQNYR